MMQFRERLKEMVRTLDPDVLLPCPKCAASIKAKNMMRHFDKCPLALAADQVRPCLEMEPIEFIASTHRKMPSSPKGILKAKTPFEQRPLQLLRCGKALLLIGFLVLMISAVVMGERDSGGQWYDKHGHPTVGPTPWETLKPGGHGQFLAKADYEPTSIEDVLVWGWLSSLGLGVLMVAVGSVWLRIASGRWPREKELWSLSDSS